MISVCMSCYNKANLIEQTLKSWLRHPSIPDEFIILDNGGDDNIRDIISSYNFPDNTVVKFYRREGNFQLAYPNRDDGIDKMYIKFDKFFTKDKLGEMWDNNVNLLRNGASGKNIAIKLCSNDICILSDPECIQFNNTTHIAQQLPKNTVYYPHEVYGCPGNMTTDYKPDTKPTDYAKEDKLGVDLHATDNIWQYTTIFNKEDFFKVEGYPEAMDKGWGGEDDCLHILLINHGVNKEFPTPFIVLHQRHGERQRDLMGNDTNVWHNKEIMAQYWDAIRRDKIKHLANTSYGWNNFADTNQANLIWSNK